MATFIPHVRKIFKKFKNDIKFYLTTKTDTIEYNIQAYNRVYDKYEQIHTEIFNPVEQKRLYKQIEQAISYIKTSPARREALDYGCGSGNLTKFLINLDFYVIAADISDDLLRLVKEKYAHTGMVETLKVNGRDLSNIENDRFDFVGAYSVLHHVPDYLQIIKEMIRVTKRGGIIYLDHEINEAFWNMSREYKEYLRLIKPRKNWGQLLLNPLNYINEIRCIINPRFQIEGDIHVFPDDNINWNKIENLLVSYECEIVLKEDYLLYRGGYPLDIYEKYKDICNDTRLLISRKK